MTQELTDAELVFVKRMLPHFIAGKSVEESAAAILEDDARLFTALFDRSSDHFVPGYNDHTGRTHRTREGKGDVIASAMARTVYDRLRSNQSAGAQ
ncbi:hypothetical protein [Neorhizobium sp. LjRoot104]|uniref:hypothetical protein n=1 Tax=Neorhizobium sp. LjRoot104 TaxID=3342254 RepID=UPI003ECD9DBA